MNGCSKLTHIILISLQSNISKYILKIMHNIYAPFIITSLRVIHSVATPNPTLAVWRLPGPAPASCCPPALLLWRQATWKQGDIKRRPPMPVSTSTMPGCWAGLAWYRGCTAVDPPPCWWWRWSQEWGTALACTGLAWAPPHSATLRPQ